MKGLNAFADALDGRCRGVAEISAHNAAGERLCGWKA